MFSLAGLPPVAGLWGKLMLFGSALQVQDAGGVSVRPWFIGLAIVGVLNAAVAAYYYLRIISLMYFREPLAALRAEGGRGPFVAARLCSLAVLALGFYPAPLMKGCVEAGRGRRKRGAGSKEQERPGGMASRLRRRVGMLGAGRRKSGKSRVAGSRLDLEKSKPLAEGLFDSLRILRRQSPDRF